MIVPSVPKSLQLKMYGVSASRIVASFPTAPFSKRRVADDDRVELEVVVHPLCGGERGNLDDLTAHEAQDVDRMASAAEERAAALGLGDERPVPGIDVLQRMPVVGLAIDEVAEDAVGDELLDGLELRVPAQDEAGHRLDARLRDRVPDRERVVERHARPASR